MTSRFDFDSFARRLCRLIEDSSESHKPGAEPFGFEDKPTPDEHFETLALELFTGQFEQNDSYRNFSLRVGVEPGAVRQWHDIPALPTSAFKEFAVSCLPPPERTTEFNSSGTRAHTPSRHFHSAKSLHLYETSLRPWFRKHLLPDFANSRTEKSLAKGYDTRGCHMRILSLTPSKAEAPRSSLAHMFDVVIRDFGAHDSFFAGRLGGDGEWHVDHTTVLNFLKQSAAEGEPVLLLGTAFLFVNFLDQMPRPNLKLPGGSRLLETGGYKGRSRECSKTELHALITERLGIPSSHIAGEYGMSELSSQAYDTVVGLQQLRPSPKVKACASEPVSGDERLFRLPPWARAQIISPETGREVDEGQTGLIRIFDLANAYSVMAIQTEDLGIRRRGGFELLGRAETAEPRGCSLLAADLP